MERKTENQVTYQTIRQNEEINALIEKGNEVLKVLGYTEHSRKHAAIVAEHAAEILTKTGATQQEVELAKIAGYMHDIGNSINRHDHDQSGAVLAYQILKGLGMPLQDILVIMTAIGNHDEKTGIAVDKVSAALILADKTDVRRNRVQNPVPSSFDIHDRVNYAALSATLEIQTEEKVILMRLELDDAMCSVMDYFEIFLQRMVMCKRASETLGYRFKLVANGSKLC